MILHLKQSRVNIKYDMTSKEADLNHEQNNNFLIKGGSKVRKAGNTILR